MISSIYFSYLVAISYLFYLLDSLVFLISTLALWFSGRNLIKKRYLGNLLKPKNWYIFRLYLPISMKQVLQNTNRSLSIAKSHYDERHNSIFQSNSHPKNLRIENTYQIEPTKSFPSFKIKEKAYSVLEEHFSTSVRILFNFCLKFNIAKGAARWAGWLEQEVLWNLWWGFGGYKAYSLP